MHLWLLDHLSCPACHTVGLTLKVATEEHEQVMEGMLTCTSCHRSYPIKKGIPRFVDSDSYTDTFSFQRRAVRKHWNDFYNRDTSAERLFPSLTPLPIEAYQKGILLDAGCGYGRWVRFFSDRGVQVVGVDLSTDSIELCAREYLLRKNVALIQADITQLPFPQEHFDNIFSFGVMHHTPNTHATFARVVRYLKPGGYISIYVYSVATLVDAYRKLTTKLPLWLLYGLLVVHHYAIMSWMRYLGPIRMLYNRIVPSGSGDKAWQRVHNDFDTFSPVYADRNVYPTVYNWFQELGLEDIHLTPVEIAITARKPVEKQAASSPKTGELEHTGVIP